MKEWKNRKPDSRTIVETLLFNFFFAAIARKPKGAAKKEKNIIFWPKPKVTLINLVFPFYFIFFFDFGLLKFLKIFLYFFFDGVMGFCYVVSFPTVCVCVSSILLSTVNGHFRWRASSRFFFFGAFLFRSTTLYSSDLFTLIKYLFYYPTVLSVSSSFHSTTQILRLCWPPLFLLYGFLC